jgi:hypothetical protein
MSVTVADKCRKLRVGAAEKSVLMNLADHAHDDGSSIFPSAQTVAIDCCLSRRTVLRCFERLEDLGVLRLKGRRGCGRGNTNHYNIDLQRVAELIATGPPYKPSPTHQKKGDTATPFINGETVDITTLTAQKSPDTDQIKGDTATPIEAVKGDTLSVKGDTVSPEPSGTVIEENVSPRGLTVPEAPEDHSEILWALIPALMQISGQKERAVWALMKAWRKQYGAALVVQVISATIAEKRDKPVPWIFATLAERQRAGSAKLRIIPGGYIPDGDDDPRWPLRLASYRDGRPWEGRWGVEPGQPGCRAPAHLVAEILKEGAA